MTNIAEFTLPNDNNEEVYVIEDTEARESISELDNKLDNVDNVNGIETEGTLPTLDIDDKGYIVFNEGTLPTLKNIYPIIYKVPSWSTGTDEEIVDALDKHYAGKINLLNNWNVGDSRTVRFKDSLTTLVDYPGYLNPAAKTAGIPLVIWNKGGKNLTNPINGKEECAFIVGFEDYIDDARIGNGNWPNTVRYDWCQSVFKNAIPDSLIGAFKEFVNISNANNTADGTVTSNDYFTLLAEKELFGVNDDDARAIGEASLSQFERFTNSDNIKPLTNHDNIQTRTRVAYAYSATRWVIYSRSYGIAVSSGTDNYSIIPYGVI